MSAPVGVVLHGHGLVFMSVAIYILQNHAGEFCDPYVGGDGREGGDAFIPSVKKANARYLLYDALWVRDASSPLPHLLCCLSYAFSTVSSPPLPLLGFLSHAFHDTDANLARPSLPQFGRRPRSPSYVQLSITCTSIKHAAIDHSPIAI